MWHTGRCRDGSRSASRPSREGGYTFIDSLLQLTIFSMFCLFSLAFLTWAGQTAGKMTDDTAVEWELFRRELMPYLRGIDDIRVHAGGEGVSVGKSGTITDIERHGEVIRKRVDREGHEQMLTGVGRARFFMEGNRQLVLIAKFSNGTERRTTHTLVFKEDGE
ncbi:ComGF family competence protein [Bhargavaea ullalensis]|uniref:Competence protein ComGF n=1 Tax=Bhargavaea ullalensis TaxID=1265685 RepID=A0ABV2G9M8_9BACL